MCFSEHASRVQRAFEIRFLETAVYSNNVFERPIYDLTLRDKQDWSFSRVFLNLCIVATKKVRKNVISRLCIKAFRLKTSIRFKEFEKRIFRASFSYRNIKYRNCFGALSMTKRCYCFSFNLYNYTLARFPLATIRPIGNKIIKYILALCRCAANFKVPLSVFATIFKPDDISLFNDICSSNILVTEIFNNNGVSNLKN